MTIAEALQGLTAFPINPVAVQNICAEAGVDAATELTHNVRNSAAYKHAVGLTYDWITNLPASISEGGVSLSMSDGVRDAFRRKSRAMLAAAGVADDTTTGAGEFGYVSNDF